MSGVLWEHLGGFIAITVVLGGGAAWLTGRGAAITWTHPGYIFVYSFLLTCASRFLHYALGDGPLLATTYFLVDFAVILASMGLAFRVTRANQMATQYFWLYERTSPVSWREIAAKPEAN